MPSRSFIVGTAGHIDHGKTALVRALTGVDTDRLKEEKRRGITIELGFANLQLQGDSFGIVDVPGHERFIKSMVAGAGGIDVAILVVAADEGVMPQTREHLDICSLLGVRRGLVALTKKDLVDDEWLALVSEDLRGALAGTFLEASPIVPCSAQSGEGIDDVGRALSAAVDDLGQRDPDGLLRLPLDRVFTMKGFGTIVTGSLHGGRVRKGDEVTILPSEATTVVRRVQVHGEEVPEAIAGQRTALNLGGVDRQAVARGEVVATPGTLTPSSMIDVRLRLLRTANKGLKARSRVLFHLGTRQQECACVLLDTKQLGPGDSALAQLRFDRGVVALPGDRFILRGFAKQENHGTTIGGGEVVRVLGRKVNPRNHKAVELIQRISTATSSERIALEVLAAAPAGITRQQLQCRLALPPKQLDARIGKLLSEHQVLAFGSQLVHASTIERLEARTLEILDQFHQDNPLRPGISRAELHSRLLGAQVDSRFFFLLAQRLQRDGQLEMDQDLCFRPQHRQQVGAALGPLAERLANHYERAALGPPRQAEVVEQIDAPKDQLEAAIRSLVSDGTLVKVGDLLFHQGPLAELESRLRDYLQQHEQISPGEFKALVGKSRKFTIPLAEHFDARGVTIRQEDFRKLR